MEKGLDSREVCVALARLGEQVEKGYLELRQQQTAAFQRLENRLSTLEFKASSGDNAVSTFSNASPSSGDDGSWQENPIFSQGQGENQVATYGKAASGSFLSGHPVSPSYSSLEALEGAGRQASTESRNNEAVCVVREEDADSPGSEAEFLIRVAERAAPGDGSTVPHIPSTSTETKSDKDRGQSGKKGLHRQPSMASGRDSAYSETNSMNIAYQQRGVGWLREFRRLYLFGVLHPDERGKWDLYILVLMCWVCLISPYTICFGITRWKNDLPNSYLTKTVCQADLNSTIGILELVVDISFAHDIYLNFRTSFYDEEGELIERKVMIARNYMKGWFGVDLVSVLPFDIMLAISDEDGGATKLLEMSRIIKAVKILRLLKAVKMLKLLRVPQLLDVLERVLGKPMFRLLRFLFAVIILSHWSACFFYYMAYLQPSTRTTWLNKVEMETATNTERYVTSLYWAFATMTSVGYGDVVAVTINEKFTAIVCMIVGVTVFAYLMGAVTSLLGALNSSQARIAAKKQRVDDFLRARKVPQVMANKIRQFYSYIVDKEVRNDETDIIAGLPNKLRTEVILYLFRETLEKVLYFENKAPKFIAELVMMMKIEFYAPEDFVVVQGEQSTEMYFVGEGTLAIRDYGNIENLPKILYSGENVDVEFKHLGFIHAGSQFGEYACLTMEPRTATVVAHTFVELHSLSRAALQEVMGRWPEYGNEMTHHMMKQSRATKDKKRQEKAAVTLTGETPGRRSSAVIKPSAERKLTMDTGSLQRRANARHGVNMGGGNNANNTRILSNMDEFFHPMFTSQSDEVFHPHK